jgi:hypothetical protein
MQDGYKIYTDSYMASKVDHVSWSLGLFSDNHLVEVGLTRYRKSTTLKMLTTIGLFSLIMCEKPHE